MRGWGPDGLGPGARGRGARARRALKSTTRLLSLGWRPISGFKSPTLSLGRAEEAMGYHLIEAQPV
jgi:hypothetical protein